MCECALCARAARTVCAHAVRLVTLLRIFFQSKRVAKYEPVLLADGALLLRSQLGDLRVVWRAIKGTARSAASDIDKKGTSGTHKPQGGALTSPLRGQAVAAAFLLALEGSPEQAVRALERTGGRVAAAAEHFDHAVSLPKTSFHRCASAFAPGPCCSLLPRRVRSTKDCFSAATSSCATSSVSSCSTSLWRSAAASIAASRSSGRLSSACAHSQQGGV